MRGYGAVMKTPPLQQIDTWQQAEHNAAAWMQHWGYRDASALPGGPDHGVDVRATGAIGQVKFQGAAVGRPALQRLVGASDRPGDQLFFFTGSNYSAAAVTYADERRIALFQYDPWGRMTPMSTAAHTVVRTAADRARDSRKDVGVGWITHGTAAGAEPASPGNEQLKKHFKENWLAWVGGYLAIAPPVMVFDEEWHHPGEPFGGPWWLDVLVWLVFWGFAAGFLFAHRQVLAVRRRQSHPVRDRRKPPGL